MIKDQISSAILERIRNCDELGDNWDYGLNRCHKDMVTILTENINETIDYIFNDCNDEDYYWISEVFEDIAEKTQSKVLIQTLRSRLARVRPETYCQQSFQSEHMRKRVDYAEYVSIAVASDCGFERGTVPFSVSASLDAAKPQLC